MFRFRIEIWRLSCTHLEFYRFTNPKWKTHLPTAPGQNMAFLRLSWVQRWALCISCGIHSLVDNCDVMDYFDYTNSNSDALNILVVHLRPGVGRPSHGWEQIPTQAWNWSQIIMTGHWPMTNDHEGYYHDYWEHHPGQKANMAKTSTAAGRHDLKLSQAASQWRIGT